MNEHPYRRNVGRQILRIYMRTARLLLPAALAVSIVIALDNGGPRRSAVLVGSADLLSVVLLGLFACFVVLAADAAYEENARRSVPELVNGVWSALARLLLPGLAATIAISLLTSIGTVIVLGLVAVQLLSGSSNGGSLSLLLFLLPVVVLLLEVFLVTIWSVFAPVAVLERPRGLRALGRSRELVRGNGWRAGALMLILVLPALVAANAIEGAAVKTGTAVALCIGLPLASLLAPIPGISVTVLYLELSRIER